MKVKRFSKNSFYRKLKLDKQTWAVIRWFDKIKPKMIADLRYPNNKK